MDITTQHPTRYYDFKRGWNMSNPGWHEIRFEKSSYRNHLEMLDWMFNRIDNPFRHAIWTIEWNMNSLASSYFKFRYERDFLLFRLSW
jgi:hypothetical protein